MSKTNKLQIIVVLVILITGGLFVAPLIFDSSNGNTGEGSQIDKVVVSGDADQLADNDECPDDPLKTEPGECGCGVPDTDRDGDGTADCNDDCPDDPNKVDPGQCGCGVPDTDRDGDGTADCNDGCPLDPYNTTDKDGDGVGDNTDFAPDDPKEQYDSDGDGVGDNKDNDPTLIDKVLSLETLVILSILVSLLSVLISFYLYRWRAIMLKDGTSAVVPESLGEELKSLKKAVDSSQKHLGESVERQASFVQGQAKAVKTFSANIGRQGNQMAELIEELKERITSMRSMLAEKDAEIKRLKTGHDQAVYKRFVARFVRLEARMNKLLANEDVSQKDLNNFKILLEDAIEQTGVESFSPKIGNPYGKEFGVEDNPKIIETNNAAEDETIAEVLSVGYKTSDTEEEGPIIPAKVSIYKFVKKEESKKEE